jgi:LPPG:FO 2-phospho-L-lactate transferase
MAEMGLAPGPLAIAQHYAGLFDGLVIDQRDSSDAGAIRALGVAVATTQTVMQSEHDKVALAGFTLQFAQALSRRKTDEAKLGNRAP